MGLRRPPHEAFVPVRDLALSRSSISRRRPSARAAILRGLGRQWQRSWFAIARRLTLARMADVRALCDGDRQQPAAVHVGRCESSTAIADPGPEIHAMSDEKQNAYVARNDADANRRLAAVRRLNDEANVAWSARNDADPGVR